MSKNISNIIEIWSNFDIKSLQHELDDKVIEIAQQLEEGDQSRKRLIEQTKEFRKNLNDDQKKLVAPILKLFQVEVDNSSKRSKLMEQVLLKLYKNLIDLPDPNSAFENVQRQQKKAERVQDLEIENKQLRDTLEEYNLEFAQVKNQEVTIKQLRDKIKELENKIEQSVQQKLKEKEKELQRLYTDKEEQYQTNQLNLIRKLGETEAKNLNLQSQLQVLQDELNEFKSKQDELLNAKSCEIDILLQDLDKMNERAVNAERLVEQYMLIISDQSADKIININSPTNKSSLNKLNEQIQQNEMKLNFQTSSFELELVAKEKEISQLVEDIQKLQMKSNKTREFYETQRSQLEDLLLNQGKALEKLEQELRIKQDYDEIKRELNILKTIEFNLQMDENYIKKNTSITFLNENNATFSSTSINQHENEQSKSLEILLLEKNRFLQNENTQMKNKLIDLNQKYETTLHENSNLIRVNLEQKALIIELEKDLLKIARNNQQPFTQQQLNSSEQSAKLEKAASIMLNIDSSETNKIIDNQQLSSNIVFLNDNENNDVSLFNIVSNQRERFRIRMQELETESIANKQQSLFLTNELDRLKSENLKLFEKIKFLQSVTNSNSNRKTSNIHKAKQSDIEYDEFNPQEDDSYIVKYNNDYEKRLDPFSKFSYREKQKRYLNLQLHDKFTLNFSRFILSNKTSRLIFCAYFFIIHLLIFLNLYNMAHNDKSNRDISAECAHSFRDHMAKIHGVNSFEPPH